MAPLMIIGILKDRRRRVVDDRVHEIRTDVLVLDQAEEDVGNNDKGLGRDGITLTEAIAAGDPFSRDPVQEDGGLCLNKLLLSCVNI